MSRFNIRCETKELVLKQPFTIARGTRKTVPNVFITLSADGCRGVGEAAPNSRYDENASKVTAFIENLPDDFFENIPTVEALSAKLDARQPQVKSARAAVEMAWLDWWGKKRKKPLWRLWNAPSNSTPPTSYTIGLDTLEVMREKVRAASAYPILKVKLGTDRDRTIIETIREITEKPIRVDANEGWKTLDEAKAKISFLAGRNIEMVEQPMPSAMTGRMKGLKQWSPLPLMADESFIGEEDLGEIAEAFHGINVKLMKIGSLVKARAVFDEARKRNLNVMTGCMIESSLANTAGALLGLWSDYVDLDGHLLIKNDPYEGLNLDHEMRAVLSQKPGLGVSEIVNQKV